MAHYMAIRIKCSIMIINAPYEEGEVSLNNSAHNSQFTIHLSTHSMTSRWVELPSVVVRVTK